MRFVIAATVALLAAPASATGLAVPIDMIEAAPGTLAPAPDSTPAERAYGLVQRGDWAGARAAAEPLAEAGNAAMAALMARIHGEGLGTVRDTVAALRWMERAAEAGDRTARHDLAVALLTGSGIERDEPRALALLRALADDGHAEASYDLAQALLAGERTGIEREEGERALRAAADAGLPQALYALARFMEASSPDGLSREAASEALSHLVTASRAGLPEAQLELGVWLLVGRHGIRDDGAARVWLERAARAGLRPAMERLAALQTPDRAAPAVAGSASTLPGVRWDEPRRSRPADPRTGRVGKIDPGPNGAR